MPKARWIDWTVATSWVVGGGLFLGGLSVAAAGDDAWAAPAHLPTPASDTESANLVPPPPFPGRAAPAVTVPVAPPPESKPASNAGWAPTQPAALPTSLESDPSKAPPKAPASSRPAPARPAETPAPKPTPAEPRVTPTPSVWGSYKPVNQPVSSPPPATPVHREQPTGVQASRMPQAPPPATTASTTTKATPTPMRTELQRRLEADQAGAVHKATPTPMTTELQQRVMGACGAAAQKVTVARQSDGVLTVEVRVQNPTDAEAVSAKVLALKEMMSLGATLKIVIDNPGR